MDNNKVTNKRVKIISLILIMLCVVVLLIFNSNISGSIGARIKEIVGASSIETKIDYKIEQLIGNKLEIYVTINNERGIQTGEQENKNIGEQGNNINRVGNYNFVLL